jgi:hypothetical protein
MSSVAGLFCVEILSLIGKKFQESTFYSNRPVFFCHLIQFCCIDLITHLTYWKMQSLFLYTLVVNR